MYLTNVSFNEGSIYLKAFRDAALFFNVLVAKRLIFRKHVWSFSR